MLTRREAIKIAVGFPASVVTSRSGADTCDEFWEMKSPSEWNADEIKRITIDSPWAHSPSSVYAVRDQQDRPFSERTPLDLPRPDKARKIIGRWESARVIQDALRGKENDDTTKYYVINLSGVTWITRSLRAGNKLGERLRELQHYTKLEPQNRSIQVDHVEELLAGPSRGILFYFWRQPPITAEETQVRFVTVIDLFRVEIKFTLKDMLYHGRLDL